MPPSRLKKLIALTAEKRLSICRKCSYNSRFHNTLRPEEHCMDCGCVLVAKVKCLSCSCELKEPKWVAVVTEEEEDGINNNADEESIPGIHTEGAS